MEIVMEKTNVFWQRSLSIFKCIVSAKPEKQCFHVKRKNLLGPFLKLYTETKIVERKDENNNGNTQMVSWDVTFKKD